MTSILNKIDLGNDKQAPSNGRYSVTLMQELSEDFLEEESKGYPVLLAKYLAQMLNDLFGIQVKINTKIKSQNNFRMSEVPPSVIKKYGLIPTSGFDELKSSTIDLDIHFLLLPEEVIYIANALE